MGQGPERYPRILGLANLALGIVISATPVAAQGRHDAAQTAQQSHKHSSKDGGADRPGQAPTHQPQSQPESARPIGPRTTQGLAEDAIQRNSPGR